MPCAHPIPAQRFEEGARLRIRGRDVREFGDEAFSFSSFLFLPCGSCVGCQLSRARSWALRCALEHSVSPVASFVTLTYSDRYLPPTLSKHHLSLFRRALAKRVPGLRYFACGEYGEQRFRPHYHALVFGTSDEEMIRDCWGKGFATVEPVNPARIAYTAGYCAKKVGVKDEAEDRIDYATGEVYRYQPPFLQMSRRPGIGGHARKYWRSWRDHAVWQQRPVPVPRFLHASYLEHASESEKADLEREKLERSMTLTIRELDASEAIARKRVELKSSGRKL